MSNDELKGNASSLKPIEFETPELKADQPAAAPSINAVGRSAILAPSSGAWWQSQFNLMLLVFGLLALASILFVWLTPAPTGTIVSSRVNEDGQVEVTQSETSSTEQESPFSEAQREQARQDSQEVLSELLEAKKDLEAKQANEWAKPEFDQALQQAELGDASYQNREYAQAIKQYQTSLASLESIFELMPAELARRTSLGYTAIEEGKAELARTHFESAMLLDRNYVPALQGLDRVETLNEVLNLVSSARVDEETFLESDSADDIEASRLKYANAVELDAKFLSATEGLERATQLKADKQYRVAMSQGFNALFANRYSQARAGFNRALEIKPNDKTASSALRQALASDTRSSLSSLLSGAKRFEAQEQWSSALSNYQTVLQRDRNQVTAKIGQIRSSARLDLENRLKAAMADPLTLSKSTAREAAQAVLAEAQAIKQKGARLNQQIASLESTLKRADATIRVSFMSDSLTEVSLKKEGAKRIRLGRFNEKKLALKPGRYTLIGTRLGFQDQRQELELSVAKGGEQTFAIACSDPIADAG